MKKLFSLLLLITCILGLLGTFHSTVYAQENPNVSVSVHEEGDKLNITVTNTDELKKETSKQFFVAVEVNAPSIQLCDVSIKMIGPQAGNQSTTISFPRIASQTIQIKVYRMSRSEPFNPNFRPLGCNDSKATKTSLKETSYTPTLTGQISDQNQKSSTSEKISFPFSLPKDPTRFAGMKILDLFNPIGTGAGLLQIILGLALAVSFLFFALGAVRYMLSAGDAKKAEEARNHITMAVVGLVIVVVAFFLVQILGRVFGTGITE